MELVTAFKDPINGVREKLSVLQADIKKPYDFQFVGGTGFYQCSIDSARYYFFRFKM